MNGKKAYLCGRYPENNLFALNGIPKKKRSIRVAAKRLFCCLGGAFIHHKIGEIQCCSYFSSLFFGSLVLNMYLCTCKPLYNRIRYMVQGMKKYVLDLVVKCIEQPRPGYVVMHLTDPIAPLPAMLPGQFVEVRVDASPSTFLRRPISINYVDRQSNELWLLVHAVGGFAGEDFGDD